MATLRDIKRKIEGVKKTQKITRAMNMVASAKLRTTQDKMQGFRPYAHKFMELLQSVKARGDPGVHPLLLPHDEVNTVEIILLTSDRGLCGAFNTNLIATAERFMKDRSANGQKTSLTTLGHKGRDYFRRRKVERRREERGILENPNMSTASEVGREVTDLFLAGTCDEVHIIFSHFVSMAIQKPNIMQLIPIPLAETTEEPVKGVIPLDYIYEPSVTAVVKDLLPTYINVQILNCLWETAVSEHAARMTAMDNATRNCGDMISSLTLVMNKARQAAITAELMDIVGCAEALRGK